MPKNKFRLCSKWMVLTISLLCTPAFALDVIPPRSHLLSLSESDAYPNNPDGLRILLNDLLAAARKDDQAKLWSIIEDLQIPDYVNWFPTIFGPEKGTERAQRYASGLKTSNQQFQMLMMELARQDGDITVSKVDTTKRDSLAGPRDEYRADWKKTDSSPGPSSQSVGIFCFVQGKFRLLAMPHDLRPINFTAKGTGQRVQPAKLLVRVPPEYPKEARPLRIEGLVALNVIVHKDGTVTLQNVAGGHPLLVPAAVEAVQQWRYQPTMVDGEPIEVETKIYVTFVLNPQK